MERFPYIHASGTALERGRQIGTQAREQIDHNIAAYERTFAEYAGLDWADAREKAKEYAPWIERYDPEIMMEIRGMAEGAGRDLIDLVALNARTEIMLRGSMYDGCTSMVALPPATAHGETLLGQNWDWTEAIKPGVIGLEIEQSPRPTILMLTEAGIVGKIGMNSAGLGVCLNFLGTAERAPGVPVHVLLRGILNSKTVSQAVGQIARMPRGGAANYLVAHKEGEAVDVETSPSDYDVLYPAEGVLTHANHFIGPRQLKVQDTARVVFPDTHLRQGRSTKILSAQKGEIDGSTFKAIFSDHAGYPDAICRHGDLFPPDLGRPSCMSTVFSIVMNLSAGTFEATTGQPCAHAYERYAFSSLAQQVK